ncbi:MAG TPA: TonB family protein [Thermoanaerobaculia bacterium]
MGRKALLIEYEPRYVERLRGLLAAEGWNVTEAHDGEEGLASFGAAPFDLIVLSGMLPKLPSAEVIREIRRKGGAASPPILLLMTGYTGNNPKADAQKVGAFDILVKPFPDDAFTDAIREAGASADLGARTMKISTESLAASTPLTSNDIFSEVLREVSEEGRPTVRVDGESVRETAPAPPEDDEIERRLRDTLSGLMQGGKPVVPARTPPSPPVPQTPRYSTDDEIDRMLADTLSGLGTPKGKPVTSPGIGPGVLPAPAEREPTAPGVREPTGPGAREASAPGHREPTGPGVAAGTGSVSGGRDPDKFGQYEIIGRIGSGGMAELYKARRSGVEGFQKIVAIKKILPHLANNEEFLAMFADEAKLAAHLNHPNIVHIYDLGKIDGGGYFIAMEYVEGRDLRAILESARQMDTPLPVPLAVYVAAKVASALDYAHRRREADGRELGIVHRDVSPQNILISYEGEIKLCDFGIAKAASKASQTQSGALKGKVQYMSPEQAWGRPIDRRSDLFSLGVVLSEMLTGERLFRGEADLTVLEKVRAAEVRPPSTVNPEVPPNLDAIVMKALAREPEDRYANSSDLLRDLELVLYSYTPAPGSADLAIFLHRLQAEEAALAEARARQAAEAQAAAAAAAGEPDKKKKMTVTRRTRGTQPRIDAPSASGPGVAAAAAKDKTGPGVYGAPAAKRAEAERRSRAPLYVLIVLAAALLGAGAWYVTTKGMPISLRPAPVPTPVPSPLPANPTPPGGDLSAVGAAPPPGATPPPAAAYDPKQIEEEVQRQLAARRRELQKEYEQRIKAQTAAGAAKEKPEPPVEPTALPALLEPTLVPTVEPTEAPPPTAVPRPTATPHKEPETQRGDLVGPGPGVTEPELLAAPKINYPPLARQQRVGGKVVVLVLVDEEGKATEARLQQGVASKSGVNEAVVEGGRRSRFRPATKNGIPVKMWRTVVVDVRP